MPTLLSYFWILYLPSLLLVIWSFSQSASSRGGAPGGRGPDWTFWLVSATNLIAALTGLMFAIEVSSGDSRLLFTLVLYLMWALFLLIPLAALSTALWREERQKEPVPGRDLYLVASMLFLGLSFLPCFLRAWFMASL